MPIVFIKIIIMKKRIIKTFILLLFLAGIFASNMHIFKFNAFAQDSIDPGTYKCECDGDNDCDAKSGIFAWQRCGTSPCYMQDMDC